MKTKVPQARQDVRYFMLEIRYVAYVHKVTIDRVSSTSALH